MPMALEVDCDSHGKSWFRGRYYRATLFINCSTGLNHKTEEGGLSNFPGSVGILSLVLLISSLYNAK